VYESTFALYGYKADGGGVLCFVANPLARFPFGDSDCTSPAPVLSPAQIQRIGVSLDTTTFSVPTLRIQSPPLGEAGTGLDGGTDVTWLCRRCMPIYGAPGAAFHHALVARGNFHGCAPGEAPPRCGPDMTAAAQIYYYWYPKP
jgi:hypothetical protein